MNQKYISWIFLLIYAAFYFYVWSLFLGFQDFEPMKPWAKVWISSAIACLLMATPRRQHPLMSFFIGSVFGPLGFAMVLFSEKDIRFFKEDEKTNDFYKKIFTRLISTHQKICDYSRRRFFNFTGGSDLAGRLEYYASYLKVKLNMKANWVGRTMTYPPEELLKGLDGVVLGFKAEYEARFGEECSFARGIRENISQDIRAIKLGNELSY